MVALSNFMILFPCLILSRPGRQRQLENRIQWPGGKIQSWLMLVKGVGNRCPISACFVPRISRFFSFSFSNPGRAGPKPKTWTTAWRKDSILVDAYERRWQSLLCLCPCIEFQDFYHFRFRAAAWKWPGPLRVGWARTETIRSCLMLVSDPAVIALSLHVKHSISTWRWVSFSFFKLRPVEWKNNTLFHVGCLRVTIPGFTSSPGFQFL